MNVNRRATVHASDVTGLVLAGGRATRMGGVEKGLQAFRGRPLVAHVVERLAPQVRDVIVSANRARVEYEALGLTTIGDLLPDLGPLGGIAAGLATCRTGLLVTAPCDAPFVPLDLVARLGSALAAGVAASAARTTSGRHPVFCLMRADVGAALDDFIGGGGCGVADWLGAVGGAYVDFDDDDAFRNLNTRDELEVAARTTP